MNARKWVSGLTALSLALSSGVFAQTFSQQAPVPDRAHDGDRGEEARTGRDVTRGDIREQERRERRYEQQQQRDQGRDRRNDRDWQRERDAQQQRDWQRQRDLQQQRDWQRQRDLQQQRDWERQRDLQRNERDWRRVEPRPDYRGRDMRYERGAGPSHNWYRGTRLPPEYRTRHYIVEDWRGHRLSAPPPGYYWVQSGSDYLLVAIATGVIAQLLLNN